MAQSPKTQVKELLDYINALEAQVAQKDAVIAARDASIATLADTVAARDATIGQLTTSNATLQTALDECMASHPTPPPPVPVDAVLGEKVYSAWSECVNGQQSRTWTRAVITPAQNGGATGETEGTETRACTMPPPPPPPPPVPAGWSTLPNTKMRPVIPTPRPGEENWGSRGPDAVTEAWNSCCIGEDVDGVPMMIWPCTGGHGDWFGSHVYTLRDEPGATWVNRTPDMAAYTTVDMAAYTMPNGEIRPSSRHTFQGVQWLPQLKKVLILGGSIWKSGFYSPSVFLWSPATNKFERKADMPMAREVASVYDPVTGHVFYTQNGTRIFEYDPVADTHTNIGPSANKWLADYNGNCMLAMRGRELWLFKGVAFGTASALVYTLGDADWQPRVIQGYENWWYPGVEWDEALGKFVLWGGVRDPAGEGAVQLIDPVANTAQIIPGGGSHFMNGTIGKFRRFPSGKYWLCRDIDEDVLVLNIGAVSVPPAAPIDCVLSEWSAWTPTTEWSACVGGVQSRTERRTRTVLVSPQNGGAACGPTEETRMVTQLCTVPNPNPDPTPQPLPELSAVRYRYQHPRLFQPAPPPGLVASPELSGPTYQYVAGGWQWTRLGGDWIDAAGVPWGSEAFAATTVNKVSGSTAVAAYTMDFKAALEAGKSRWNAFILMTSNPSAYRKIAANHPDYPRPQIAVTYTDGSNETLEAYVIAASDRSVTTPGTLWQEMTCPVFIEFRRPDKDKTIASATFAFTLTAHYSGTTLLNAYLLNPPVNTLPTEQGVAQTAGDYDEGLEAKVINVHRYVDGTKHSDFVSIGRPSVVYNNDCEAGFSPHLWDSSLAPDTTKLPYLDQGKWISTGRDWQLVPSTWAGENFKPLAPGMGAMRVHFASEIPGGAESVCVRTGYGSGANGHIYLPEQHFGYLKKLYIRCYYRLASYSMVGKHYKVYQFDTNIRSTETPQVIEVSPGVWKVLVEGGAKNTGSPEFSTPEDAARWMEQYHEFVPHAGKIFLSPNHKTSYGSGSGSSGGNRGWTLRCGWSDSYRESLDGPDDGGITVNLHTYDLGVNNPVNYSSIDRYKDTSFGQQGGLGYVFYFDRWYCVEYMIDLNSVMLADPGYLKDGEIKVWVDGRLTIQRVGQVLRQLPLMPTPGGWNPLVARRPCRELGHTGVWFNWHHGGLTPPNIDRTLFFTGVVLSESYIGPMKGL